MERPSQHSGGDLPQPGDRLPVEAERTNESSPHAAQQDRAARRRSITQVASVLACVTAITLYVHLGARRKAKPAAPVVPAVALAAGKALPNAKSEPAEASAVAVVPAREEPQPPPEIDRAAVAEAEAELDAASRERARADERAAAAARRLGQATGKAALDAARRGNSPFWFATRQLESPRPPLEADSCAESATRFKSSSRPCASFRGPSRLRS